MSMRIFFNLDAVPQACLEFPYGNVQKLLRRMSEYKSHFFHLEKREGKFVEVTPALLYYSASLAPLFTRRKKKQMEISFLRSLRQKIYTFYILYF